MSSKDIIFQSTYENIKKFIEGKSLKNLIELSLYISSEEKLNRPPSEFEKEFIKEFFTNDAWANHIQNCKNRYKYIVPIDPFDLQTISTILSFELLQMCFNQMFVRKKVTKKDNSKLKKDLENALDNATFDGVFDKVDGFSNLYETLIKHKLLKER